MKEKVFRKLLKKGKKKERRFYFDFNFENFIL